MAKSGNSRFRRNSIVIFTVIISCFIATHSIFEIETLGMTGLTVDEDSNLDIVFWHSNTDEIDGADLWQDITVFYPYQLDGESPVGNMMLQVSDSIVAERLANMLSAGYPHYGAMNKYFEDIDDVEFKHRMAADITQYVVEEFLNNAEAVELSESTFETLFNMYGQEWAEEIRAYAGAVFRAEKIEIPDYNRSWYFEDADGNKVEDILKMTESSPGVFTSEMLKLGGGSDIWKINEIKSSVADLLEIVAVDADGNEYIWDLENIENININDWFYFEYTPDIYYSEIIIDFLMEVEYPYWTSSDISVYLPQDYRDGLREEWDYFSQDLLDFGIMFVVEQLSPNQSPDVYNWLLEQGNLEEVQSSALEVFKLYEELSGIHSGFIGLEHFEVDNVWRVLEVSTEIISSLHVDLRERILNGSAASDVKVLVSKLDEFLECFKKYVFVDGSPVVDEMIGAYMKYRSGIDNLILNPDTGMPELPFIVGSDYHKMIGISAKSTIASYHLVLNMYPIIEVPETTTRQRVTTTTLPKTTRPKTQRTTKWKDTEESYVETVIVVIYETPATSKSKMETESKPMTTVTVPPPPPLKTTVSTPVPESSSKATGKTVTSKSSTNTKKTTVKTTTAKSKKTSDTKLVTTKPTETTTTSRTLSSEEEQILLESSSRILSDKEEAIERGVQAMKGGVGVVSACSVMAVIWSVVSARKK